MCFFGKRRYIASIACLKRALYLDPFEWIVSYNLGLVHLCTGQHASAFHFFSACVNLKPEFASCYMYLAVTLARLDDFDNACAAYAKAIELETDHLFHLNYAVTLWNGGEEARCREQFEIFERLFEGLDRETRRRTRTSSRREISYGARSRGPPYRREPKKRAESSGA